MIYLCIVQNAKLLSLALNPQLYIVAGGVFLCVFVLFLVVAVMVICKDLNSKGEYPDFDFQRLISAYCVPLLTSSVPKL